MARPRYRAAAVTTMVALFLAIAVVGDLGGSDTPPARRQGKRAVAPRL
jgi:hypothetical protein